MRTNVHNFWRALSRWKEIIQNRHDHSFFCGRCFKPVCRCGVETVNYDEALEEITYWADINIMEAHNRNQGLVQVNQGYDRDHVYPFLPSIEEKRVEGIKTRLPMGIKPVAYIARGSRKWVYKETFESADDLEIDQGITWGFELDRFYPIARYDWPYWYIYEDAPPYGVPVTITHKVTDYSIVVGAGWK